MMTRLLTRRTLLEGTAAALPFAYPVSLRGQSPQHEIFLLTNPAIDSLTVLENENAEIFRAAPSPWGMAVGSNGQAYISCAQELAIVDPEQRSVLGTAPYRTLIDTIGYGEYRPGGMGIAATPDGATIAVGIHLNGSNGVVELYDVQTGEFFATVPVGVRPFDVVASPDSEFVYSIDHDSFTITAIELATLTATTIDAAPLGYGEFDKPHYAAVRGDGTLLLPYAGQLLWILDPMTGTSTSVPMSANTHQHGITLSDDETTAYIVGTDPAGNAQGPPSLTILNLESADERIFELELPHEQIALTADGQTAILTGGYTFADGGWDGVTLLDLETGERSSVAILGRPLAIQRLNQTALPE